MTIEDIHSTLLNLNMISVLDSAQPVKPLPGQAIKFPKGRKNGVARKHLQQRMHGHDDDRSKGPFVPPTRYKVRWDADQVEEYLARWEAKGYLKLKPDKLKWSPFILSRAQKTQSSEGEAAFGTESGGVTRGPSTEVQPSEMNESGADGASTTAEARALFDLFGDDNVEVVRASAPREPAPSENTDADGSRAWSPSVDSVERTRAKRNRARDVEGPPSIRRLRSRDSVSESTPVRRRLPAPREDSVPQSRRNPLRSRHADISTPRGELNGSSHATPSLDEDAALAARLAMELDNPRRQLRARRPSNDQPMTQKRLVSSSRSVSPKKRRRVESSPEVELVPPPRSSATRRSHRNSEAPFAHPKPVPATPSRKSSRHANGRTPRRRVPRREEEEEEEAQDVLPQLPVDDGYAYGDADPTTDGEATAEPEDARYEDADTPATGATAASRHSVPSDDTMIAVDLARSKVSPIHRMLGADLDLDPLSVLAQVAGQIADGNAVLGDMGGDEDADAEGEEDVDAEGEPDDDLGS